MHLVSLFISGLRLAVTTSELSLYSANLISISPLRHGSMLPVRTEGTAFQAPLMLLPVCGPIFRASSFSTRQHSEPARDSFQSCSPEASGRSPCFLSIFLGVQAPPTPPVDPANEEFVLFIRARKFPQWYPLSVVKGGAQANVILKAMQNDLGKLLYGKTLVRNIGSVSCRQPALLPSFCVFAKLRTALPEVNLIV